MPPVTGKRQDLPLWAGIVVHQLSDPRFDKLLVSFQVLGQNHDEKRRRLSRELKRGFDDGETTLGSCKPTCWQRSTKCTKYYVSVQAVWLGEPRKSNKKTRPKKTVEQWGRGIEHLYPYKIYYDTRHGTVQMYTWRVSVPAAKKHATQPRCIAYCMMNCNSISG